MVRIGRHYSPGGSRLLQALLEMEGQQARAGQVFAGGRINREVHHPPREDLDQIKELTHDRYLTVHAAYVINMCTPPRLAAKSRTHLVRALTWAERVGFDAVLFHPGSALERDPGRAREYLLQNTKDVIERYQGPVKLLFENSAGDKRDRLVGRDIKELAQLARQVSPDIGLCIDTTHAWAAGYSLKEIAALPDKFNSIEVFHFNAPAPTIEQGSRRDRHGILTESKWSKQEIVTLAKKLKSQPLIMETRDHDDVCRLVSWLSQ